MIRLKIILIILLSIFSLIGILYYASGVFFLQSYTQIEDIQMKKNMTRVDSAIKNHNNALNIKLRDWARWDDSYVFVQDKNTDFSTSNLGDASLFNLEINLMAFINLQNEIVFAKQVDLIEGTEVPSQELTASILSQKEFTSASAEDRKMSGIIKLPEGLLLIEALPILKSDGSGPAMGTLIFGTFLDATLEEKFEELTQLSLEIFPYDSISSPEDVRTAQHEINSETLYAITPLGEEVLAGYFILYDLDANPVGIVRIKSERTIYVQGKETVATFALISGISILLLGLIVLFLLEKLLLKRFARLAQEVGSISISDLKNAEVTESNADEMGKLAEKINHLLAELVRYQKKEAEAIEVQKKANQLEKENNESLKKSLEEKAGMNQLMVERELKMIELKKEIARLQDELKRKQ